MSINIQDLEPRGIYRLIARNLILGVWTGGTWIGIREKFYNYFLDECEVPEHTAWAIEKIGTLPDEIEMRATNPTQCQECGQPVDFIPREDPHPTGDWVHATYATSCDRARPVATMYRPLYDYLVSIGGMP